MKLMSYLVVLNVVIILLCNCVLSRLMKMTDGENPIMVQFMIFYPFQIT